MTVLWSFVLAATMEISVATAVGVPVELTHDASVFWLVLQRAEILPSTLNWFLCSVVHVLSSAWIVVALLGVA